MAYANVTGAIKKETNPYWLPRCLVRYWDREEFARRLRGFFSNDPHRVALYYQAADIYLHSTRADTFPNVILEAMACGTPVIALLTEGVFLNK